MPGALDGITIIDLTKHAAGAIAAMFAADHGARIIRIINDVSELHRTGGFVVWDRGKEVRVTDGHDAEALAPILATADVLIEDHTPSGRPDHLAADHLSSRYPRLISCSITAYGEYGSLCDEPPIDDLVLARTGVLAGLPGFRAAPIHLAHPLPSTAAGILAALGISAALYEREATGRGRHVATSLVAGALLYHPKVQSEHLAPHVFQKNPYGSAPFYSVYECADGDWIQLGCVHLGFIARAAELFGLSDVLTDPVYGGGHAPATLEADDHLRARVRDAMLNRASAEWMQTFEAGDIPFACAQTTRDGMDDPQVAHNQMVISLDDPVLGSLAQMGVPVKLSATPGAASKPRPASAAPNLTVQPLNAPEAETPQNPKTLPLAGVRVLEITNLIAGPIAGRLLADIGADVIKLEPPAGDISRPIGRTYFYSVNYAKRSIAVDTAKPEGKAVVRQIAETCDVVLANLRPGATTRMGLGVDADPAIIETQISGYGLTGPYAHRPGIDPLAQALMGLERAQGGASNPPSFPAQLAPTDFTTGAMAAFGTVLALYAKKRGMANGQRVEVNLLDGGIMLSSEWFTRFTGRPERPLADQAQYGLSPFHRLYQVCDGHIYVAADTTETRAALIKTLGLGNEPSPLDSPPDGAHPNDTPFAQQAAHAFSSLTKETARARLTDAGVPCAPVADAEAQVFFADPDTHANGWSVTQMHATAGQLTAVARYIKFAGADAISDIRPTPLLGEHAGDVLGEAGLSLEEISSLWANELLASD